LHQQLAADPTAGLIERASRHGELAVADEANEPVAQFPALECLEPIAAYAGLRPAGRGATYVIGPSSACPRLINVAAIRSTGLTASLGIGAYVSELVASLGIELGPQRDPLPAAARPDASGPDGAWWRRTARHKAGAARQDQR